MSPPAFFSEQGPAQTKSSPVSTNAASLGYGLSWAPSGFFQGYKALSTDGVRRTEVPQLRRCGVQGQNPGGDLVAKPPQANIIFSKYGINTSSTES